MLLAKVVIDAVEVEEEEVRLVAGLGHRALGVQVEYFSEHLPFLLVGVRFAEVLGLIFVQLGVEEKLRLRVSRSFLS